MTLEAMKFSVVEWIVNSSDEAVIRELYETVNPQESKSTPQFGERYADMKLRKFDLEQLKKEQGYKEPNEKRILQLADEIDLEQSIDELLAGLD